MILLIFSWLSVISLIISCFARDFLSFFIHGFGERLIEYSVVLIPTIRIVKFTIRFSTIAYISAYTVYTVLLVLVCTQSAGCTYGCGLPV